MIEISKEWLLAIPLEQMKPELFIHIHLKNYIQEEHCNQLTKITTEH